MRSAGYAAALDCALTGEVATALGCALIRAPGSCTSGGDIHCYFNRSYRFSSGQQSSTDRLHLRSCRLLTPRSERASDPSASNHASEESRNDGGYGFACNRERSAGRRPFCDCRGSNFQHSGPGSLQADLKANEPPIDVLCSSQAHPPLIRCDGCITCAHRTRLSSKSWNNHRDRARWRGVHSRRSFAAGSASADHCELQRRAGASLPRTRSACHVRSRGIYGVLACIVCCPNASCDQCNYLMKTNDHARRG